MGERGPRPDPAQAVKGYPARRRRKADRVAEEAAKLARLLAPGAPSAVGLPAMLQDPKYAPAAEVWRKLAPELKRTHRLPVDAEIEFMQFCIYAQEWTSATEDLHVNGFTQKVTTVAGGKMERRRPQNLDRQQAFSNMTLLAGKFGLTPGDMYALFKDQALVAGRNPGLFGQDDPAPEPVAEPDAPAARRIGALDRMRSAPPAAKPN